MPDLLECLLVVAAGTCRRADQLRIEVTADGDLGAQIDELLPAVTRMPPQLSDRQPEAAMPFDRAGQVAGGVRHGRATVARIQNQRRYVSADHDRTVYLRLDVVVQKVLLWVGVRQADECHGRGDAEMGWLEKAVGVAEGGARENLGHQPEV